MPNLTGQPALDTAIGLFFLFFLLSVICSAINETIATALAMRSEMLLKALQKMLDSGYHPGNGNGEQPQDGKDNGKQPRDGEDDGKQPEGGEGGNSLRATGRPRMF